MPAIFIHGVPDTYRVWDQVRSRLSRTDIETLTLPGFDSPVPPALQQPKTSTSIGLSIGSNDTQSQSIWSVMTGAAFYRFASRRSDLT